MDEKKYTNSFAVELKCKKDSTVAFDALQEMKRLGLAGNDSTIVLNHVRVPAGLMNDFQQFMDVYTAILKNDTNCIFEQVPEYLNAAESAMYLNSCSNAMKDCGYIGLADDEIDNFVDEKIKKEHGMTR